MNCETLAVDTAHGVATVHLNRPDVRNAFNEVMISELRDTFARLSDDDEVRVIILAARGRAFCAGADLTWMKRMANYSDAENRADARHLASMLQTVYTCSKPVIARVHGDCYAGGMGLVAASDIVIAVPQAEFCLSEVRLGLIPATISPYVMRAMGQAAARRYFVTAERFDAHRAERYGLVHKVVESAVLDQAIADMAQTLLANSPAAMREAKRLVREVAQRPLDEDLLDDTALRIAHARTSPEGREGVAAFLEKRRPSWQSDTPSRET